jgi:glycerophosphoryl diester phosphodiesterase
VALVLAASIFLLVLFYGYLCETATAPSTAGKNIQVGTRPYFLIENMDASELKTKLQQCSEGPFHKTDFSIGHRGAGLQYPEHSKQSYDAAIRMGAGIVECDVTFTKDREMVCRHSQCDLHTTTDVLARPELAAKCSTPFDAANPEATECCASDFTLTEFESLCAKMDAANTSATTVAGYMNATPNFRTDLYAACGKVMTHKEGIELFKKAGVKMTPELKTPSVTKSKGAYLPEYFYQQY